MGNVIAVRNAKGKPKVLLAAHSDEVGLMIIYISKDGYLTFRPIGSVDVRITPGQRVIIHSRKGDVLGVIGTKPKHLQKPEEKKMAFPIEDLWIDIGAKDKEEAKKMISIGDPITFAVGFERLGNNELIVSRGLDDKVGLFVVLETFRKLSILQSHKAAVYGVSTTQEEIGFRGATTAAYSIRPDVGIVIEVTHASDYPMVKGKDIGEIVLGEGPVIFLGANVNPVLSQLLIDTAEEEKIPYQIRGLPRSAPNDANVIQINQAGVATGILSIPNRYMHTPVEVISLKDLEYASSLITKTILKMDENLNFITRAGSFNN